MYNYFARLIGRMIMLALFLFCHCVMLVASIGSDVLRHVNIDEGLTGDCVYSILRDSRGLTWVGTNNGVCLYDGRKVQPIPCDARRSLNLVYDLVELPDGSIVAAMRGGLFILQVSHDNSYTKDGEWKFIRCPLSMPVTDIRSLLVMGDSLLVGSSSGLLLLKYARDWKVTPVILGNSRMSRDNRIIDVCADGNGGAWIMSNSALYHLDQHLNATRIDADFSMVRDGMRCLCAVGGKVYIGTSWQGLLCYDSARRNLKVIEAVADGVVADLHSDGQGKLFVALDGAGAVVLNTHTDSVVQRYAHDDANGGLPSNSVYTFWQDSNLGVSFFGFFRQGFAHSLAVHPMATTYQSGSFNSCGLPVRSFCIHAPWKAIGTREGLWLVDENTGSARHFNSTELGGANVLSIAWFAERFVVATFDGGLCSIDPERGVAIRPDEAVLRKGNFTKVGTMTSSHLMAISERIVILDEQLHVIQTYDSRNSGLQSGVLTDFLFDSKGKAWLSGSNGLALYDPVNGIIQQSGFPNGFFNHEVAVNFALDKRGDVLAVSENGLYRSSDDLSRWDSIDIVSHLDVNSVTFVARQDDGYWIGTDRGLFLMDSLFQRFRHYGLAEGLPSLFCNSQSWQCTTDGTFWFSTDKGLCQVMNKNVKRDSSGYAPLYFSSIVVDGRALPLATCIGMAEERTIKTGWNFGQEVVEMTATPLDYSDGRATYLEWCVDDGPMQVTTDRRPIRLTGLSLGRHHLKLFIPGSEEAQTYIVSVWPNAAFWFEVAFVLLLLISIPLLIGYQRRVMRARALRKRKRAIEMEVHARKAVERHIQEEEQQRHEVEEARRAMMYQRARSSQEEYRRLLRELKHLMENERPYRQADLRVADVAHALHSTPNKLSQMLSQYAEATFYDFINDYRIEEFKRRALDGKFAHLSTLAIAEKCGFKKTSFYTAFAKKEGCSPAEWIRRNRSSSKPDGQSSS